MGIYDKEIQMVKDWTQEKLIDTLEKECEQLRGWHIAKIDQNAELQTQIESCSAEIERLREALEKEQQIDFVLDSRGVAHKDFVIVYKNRAALKGDE